MRVSVSKEAAVRAAKVCARVAPRKAVTPELGCVLLEADADGLRMSATDTEIAVSLPVACVVDEDGEAAVPAARLAEVLAMAPGEAVEIRISARRLEVRSGRAVTRIAMMAADAMPPRPSEVDPCLTVTAPAPELAAFLEAASTMPVGAPKRYGLSGVLLSVDGALCATSTDGHRLHRIGVDLPTEGEGPRQSLAPCAGMAALASALGGAEGDATLTVGEGAMRVECAGAVAWARMLDGEFPDASAVMPTTHAYRITVRPGDLAAAVQRAARAHAKVTLTPSGDLVEVSTSSTEGEHREGVAAEVEGEAPTIHLGATLLRDALAFIGGETVEIRSAHALAPVSITDGSAPSLSGVGRTALIMPMRA